jgi:hypothetical protein
MKSRNAQDQSGLVRLRYQDRFVYLHSDGNGYGTYTQYENGLVEFDFSNCTVLGTEPVTRDRLPEQKLLEGASQ